MAEDQENELEAVATPLVEQQPDPEEEAAKDNGGENPDQPEQDGYNPDVDFAREV